MTLLSMRKGQSAIEYLTTYGWMLLVVAIVGGAIFTTVQNQSQAQTSSGLSTADVRIDDFGYDNQNDVFKMDVRGAGQEQVENVNITLYQQDTDSSDTANSEPTIAVGDTETVQFDSITNSENTNTFDVQIRYDVGGLENLEVNGSLTGRLSHVDELP